MVVLWFTILLLAIILFSCLRSCMHLYHTLPRTSCAPRFVTHDAVVWCDDTRFEDVLHHWIRHVLSPRKFHMSMSPVWYNINQYHFRTILLMTFSYHLFLIPQIHWLSTKLPFFLVSPLVFCPPFLLCCLSAALDLQIDCLFFPLSWSIYILTFRAHDNCNSAFYYKWLFIFCCVNYVCPHLRLACGNSYSF